MVEMSKESVADEKLDGLIGETSIDAKAELHGVCRYYLSVLEEQC